MVEALAAHLGLDIDAEHVAPVVDHYHQTRVQQVDPQQGGGGDEDQSPVLTREQPVEEQPNRHREPELQHAREHRAGEVQGEKRAMWLVIGEETPEELPRPDLVSRPGLHWRADHRGLVLAGAAIPLRRHDSKPPAISLTPESTAT